MRKEAVRRASRRAFRGVVGLYLIVSPWLAACGGSPTGLSRGGTAGHGGIGVVGPTSGGGAGGGAGLGGSIGGAGGAGAMGGFGAGAGQPGGVGAAGAAGGAPAGSDGGGSSGVPGGARGASGMGGPGGASGPGGSPVVGACGARGVLYEGKVAVIDVFAHPQGFIIVRADSVSLVGRDRQVIRTVTFPREITAAAFDGTRLVVADRAGLTVSSPDLELGATAFVAETCAAAVLVSGGRFVCGPNVDWDRLFYTYDVAAATPALIATSDPETYHGVPMRWVPGTDDFVTVTVGFSPSDFYLHHVDATGKVAFVNESPYHGAFAATTVFAFDGAPAAHLIQTAGLMLSIYGEGCNSMTTSFTSGCFVKDGALGTLFDKQTFVGLTDDAAGSLFGLVGSSDTSFGSPCPSPGGCVVQKIDVASRLIESQKTYVIPSLLQVVRMTPDPKCAAVAIAYSTPDPSATYQAGGYRVETFDY